MFNIKSYIIGLNIMKQPWVHLYLSRLFDDTKNIARGLWFGKFQCDKIKQMNNFP